MVTDGVGVMGSTDRVGPGRKSLIIVSGPDVSYRILSSFLRLWLEGHSALTGLGLKHNQG